MAPCGMSVGLTGMPTTSGATTLGPGNLLARLDARTSKKSVVQPAWLTPGLLVTTSLCLSLCRRGMKAGKPYENRKQPLVSAAPMRGQCSVS